MYTNQKLQVKWGTHTSPMFEVTNGVKQGGVISPILFAVYVDGLFHKLKASGVGCQMTNYFIGCLLFADDVTLLCPTIKGLKKLIAICEQYATKFNIKFNGKKSKFLIFKGKGYKMASTKWRLMVTLYIAVRWQIILVIQLRLVIRIPWYQVPLPVSGKLLT